MSIVIEDSYIDVQTGYKPEKNITRNTMSKYEKTKIIGMRLEQITRGAKPFIDVTEGMTVRDIVLKELADNKLPFMISRTLPNGQKEFWKLEHMIVPN
jgi:DNA-directed RNA polymerase I, II, and III subunit RPABC2